MTDLYSALSRLVKALDHENGEVPPESECKAAFLQAKEALAQQANNGWQPIETAPKDGTVIVVRHNRGTWIHPKDQGNICCVCVYWNGKRWNQFGPDSFSVETVTHWMPLPPLPEVKK